MNVPGGIFTGVALSFLALVILLTGFSIGQDRIRKDVVLHGCEYVLVEIEDDQKGD